jgi:polyphosphate kinase
VLIAPSHLREGIADEIERTIEAHSADHPARIALKLNSLVDRRSIALLYRASQAGVRIDLNIRGICCLRPGMPGISENINVVSVVGRFLEHSRIYSFERHGELSLYIASADWMPRNLDTRVELAVPVESAALRAEVLEALELCLADTRNAWVLHADGAWSRREPDGEPAHDAQAELMRRHAARSAETAKKA